MSEFKEEKNVADEEQSSGDPSRSGGQEDRVAVLQRELDECKGRVLRAAADYQNAIRRSQQSIADAREQQLFEVAKVLINVLDHFDRALEVDVKTVSTQTLLQGMKMVRDEMNKVIEGFGVKRIEAKPGEEFNPSKHEGMLHQAVEGIPADHVAAQLQPGYSLGSRTLRAVKVSIAK